MRAVIDTGPAWGRQPTDGCTLAYFSPLGVTLRVKASHSRLLRAVTIACRGWEAPADPDGPMLELSLKVGPVSVEGPELVVRTDGLELAIRGNVEAHADAGNGRAWCRVTRADALDDPAFRESVLDCMILWLLTRHGRTPIHASSFIAGRTAILLAGPSGSGKSCLALAAHAAGFALLSDDTVYLETDRRFRVWGIPRPVHLFPEDAPQYERAPTRLRNGKRKRAIILPPQPRPVVAEAATLCVLDRGTRVALEPLAPLAAIEALGPLEPGFDLLAREIHAGLRRVTWNGAWRLTLGVDPAQAVALLAANLPQLIACATA